MELLQLGAVMFNLLVKYSPWADGRDTMPVARAFEYTEKPLITRFMPGDNLDFSALAALPTLFVQETSGQKDQVARVGTITRARTSGKEIIIEYSYDAEIPAVSNASLQAFAGDLGIEDFEFYRTHWTVKNADLYRAILRGVQPRRPRPRVFSLAEVENIEPSLVSVMMAFDAKFDQVYATLRSTAETAGLRCRRADDIWENPVVIQNVVSLIDRSRLVICDCTGVTQMSSMRLASRIRLAATSS